MKDNTLIALPRGPRRPSKVIWVGMSLFIAVALMKPSVGGQVIPAKAMASPLDQPIAYLQEAKRNYTAVKDYSCVMMSQERVKGVLQDENVVQFKMKTEPFSIHMRWLGPKKFQGQEVYFVAGKNNNKMKVKSNIFGGNLLGFVDIPLNDPRALQHSNHTIVEAGIGNMIEENLKHWETARKAGLAKASIANFAYNSRQCIRIEVSALKQDPAAYCYRSVIFLEKDSKLPMRLENYDWPRQGGDPAGELRESFSYVNLQFNTGLKDADFVSR